MFCLAIEPTKTSVKLSEFFIASSKLLYAKDTVIYINENNREVFTFIPMICSILALKNNMKNPFIMMITQKKDSLDEIATSLTQNLCNEAEVETDIAKMTELFKQENHDKPIIGIFTPRDLLLIMMKCENDKIDIINKTRFCVHDFARRSVYMDVLNTKLALISQRMSIENHVILLINV
ncbi:hypothetical protein TVAG_271120 [Trichomonas vaginalis G3]|uniref:Uncharacterized protein n=1 Tax=Trichomonas vaginalis (strain ATCC PRA-98 / G3) TaxID=412133 RepID=A2EA81_TRIV3|nr:ATP-dependent RNA helicase protein [Trichomonas vaginalis G3]EAY10421.1 hypothetical protein TVAG_271120 [Trichomonas vaginalis G3]KAI5548327.1 ATP-dependent RNA helicase protein [Trichomonas vaginalis G3]|eukprot:XP_001322644.1 hypothetical protein [Trichomonas vaginalis G3]